MNKDAILKSLLSNEELKTKYWPDVDPEATNLNTLLNSGNVYLKYLHIVFSDLNTQQANKALTNLID